MALDLTTPWHRRSFDRFLQETLPRLLAECLPLTGYAAEAEGETACRVRVAVQGAKGDIETEFAALPLPDANGVFEAGEKKIVVLPVASSEDLDTAEIRCVGELCYEAIASKLGEASSDLPWDETLLRAWLPLDTWLNDSLRQHGYEFAPINCLDHYTQLRRLLIPERKRVITPGQFGRTCPVETPEGPNIGKFLVLAMGARIEDGKILIDDARPEAGLGLAASCVPLLEHNDACRLLMGTNMMRQWLTPPEPEPAMVQTGLEPEVPGFWCGRNMLTAFISWGIDTHEDGLVLSASGAKRLGYPAPLEPGDKLSNRFGTKGVVSRILPDDRMPHLPDGTPVEILFSFTGLNTRVNFGQVREAVLGRIAALEGTPAIAPPFHAPDSEELRRRLKQAGLSPDGMETLTLGKDGPPLERASTVGYVYWGKLYHMAQSKIQATAAPQNRTEKQAGAFDEEDEPTYRAGSDGQMQGEREYAVLRDLGAFETIREQFHTRALAREDAGTLAQRVGAGEVTQMESPAPKFAELTRQLAVAGIQAELQADRLTFRFALPQGKTLTLAQSVPHPWLRDRPLTEVGHDDSPEADSVLEANTRLERMLAGQAPESLRQKARTDLEQRVCAYYDALVPASLLRFEADTLFSGRAVIAPGDGLRHDQIGLPEEIAWTLFGPLVIRELGDSAAVKTRSAKAVQTLDALMARSWVIVHRSPTLTPTAFIAFHPVRDPDRVIRLHPCVNSLMDADFDGDQVAVFLPITAAGQKEAGEKLTAAAHLTRNPALLGDMIKWHAGRWGVASLSLTPEGRQEIAAILDIPVEASPIPWSALSQLPEVLQRDGAEKFLYRLEQLMRRGFEAAKGSGASMSAFLGATLTLPPAPQSVDTEVWQRYADEVQEQIAARTDYADNDLGVQLLSIQSGARSSLRLLSCYAGAPGVFTGFDGQRVPIRHNLRDGLTPDEFQTIAIGTREGMAFEWERMEQGGNSAGGLSGFHILSRAMRARVPGQVFARAAAIGESDPLISPDSRLFVGLPIT